jgi:hypothetical protein
MVALQAFVDDSAAETGDRRLFLAGYIGTAIQWIAFSYAWDVELRKPPAIGYLKMSEAAGLDGQFKGWNASDRDAKVLALAQIVRAYGPWFVYCSVSRAEYARILAPVAPWPLKNPYFDCFWGVIHTAARYQAEFAPDGPPIDFIFDEQGGTGLEAVMWYGWLKEDQDPAIRRALGATPVFRDDKEVAALQAADMLAWHLRRGHERPEETLPIKALLMTEGAGIDVDAASLEQTARKFRRVPGVQFVQSKAAWRETKKGFQAYLDAGVRPPDIGLRHRWLVAKRRLREAINRYRYPRRP